MKRLTQIALVGVVLLVGMSLAAAQQVPQPVVRLGNFIEVGNDVFMHIIATADIRYRTAHNLDWEDRIRDQGTSRNPSSTAQHDTEGDLTYAELRLGADFRYQKSLTMHLLFENQFVFDGNLIDDRSNASNPGGTDIFGRGPSTENPGFRVERYWIRYKFPGTPVRLHVGADLHAWSQGGLMGNDDPRIGIDVELGDLTLWVSANVSRESQRLGLQNDNDFIYYIFGGVYDLKPHRFGADVVYYRDRWSGADTLNPANRPDLGFHGQKHDAVWINASYNGRLGPLRAFVQGNLTVGTARGGTLGLPAGVPAGRDYDILAGAVVALFEGDLGIVRPFVAFAYGSGDGNPRDNELHGFAERPNAESTQLFAAPWGFLDRAAAAGGGRDYSCPGRLRGVRRAAPAANPYAIGADVLAEGAGGAVAECYHTVSNVFNTRIGNESHIGLANNSYSNPGTLVIPVGLRAFPLKGHEITGWFVYRGMAKSSLVEAAFIRGVDPGFTGRISKTLYYEVGGFWMWTLNPHFDIRVTGNIGIPGEGTKDIARLADCDARPGVFQSCRGEDLALKGEVRFRGRF